MDSRRLGIRPLGQARPRRHEIDENSAATLGLTSKGHKSTAIHPNDGRFSPRWLNANTPEAGFQINDSLKIFSTSGNDGKKRIGTCSAKTISIQHACEKHAMNQQGSSPAEW